tara:strand:+ start:38106 stop:38420 length:315 start_codon:yes stop_codon:yes gene_type:complete
LGQGESTDIGLFKKADESVQDQEKEDKLGKEQFYDIGDLGISVDFIKLVFKGDDDPYHGNIAMEQYRGQKINGKQIRKKVDHQQIHGIGNGIDKSGIAVLVEKH